MKILFQGDSITDAGRNRDDFHDLGGGYPKYAAQYLKEAYPDIDFEFINLGIAGNETMDLIDRLETDLIEIQPDVVSVMVGINDSLHRLENSEPWMHSEIFEARYRTILEAIKNKTKAKIMILEPFIAPVEDKEPLREDLDSKIQIIRKLAREYADAYVPTDGLFASEFINKAPLDLTWDGVHPNGEGPELIGKWYFERVKPLIK